MPSSPLNAFFVVLGALAVLTIVLSIYAKIFMDRYRARHARATALLDGVLGGPLRTRDDGERLTITGTYRGLPVRLIEEMPDGDAQIRIELACEPPVAFEPTFAADQAGLELADGWRDLRRSRAGIEVARNGTLGDLNRHELVASLDLLVRVCTGT